MGHDEKMTPASHDTDLEENSFGVDKRATLTLSPSQFERLYLQSGRQATGDLRLRFANPTALGFVCFSIPITTFACYLLQINKTNTTSVPVEVGAFYFLGGLGSTIAGILEFFLGNTFPFVVFVSFSGFYYSLGFVNDINQHLTDAFGGAEVAATTPAYLNGIATYLAVWTAMLGVYTIMCLRLNAVFFILFLTVTIAVGLLAGGYFALGNAKAQHAEDLFKIAGGFMMTSAVFGWYVTLLQLLAAVEFRFSLPVYDLSGFLGKQPTKRE